MVQISNPYLGLSIPELKSLKRINKQQPEKVTLIEAALQAATPYKRGSLSKEQMCAVANFITSAQSLITAKVDVAVNPDAQTLFNAGNGLLAELEQFKIGATPPAAAPA